MQQMMINIPILKTSQVFPFIRFAITQTEHFDGYIYEQMYMVNMHCRNTKSDAIRSALIEYAIDLSLLERKDIWAKIEEYPSRKNKP